MNRALVQAKELRYVVMRRKGPLMTIMNTHWVSRRAVRSIALASKQKFCHVESVKRSGRLVPSAVARIIAIRGEAITVHIHSCATQSSARRFTVYGCFGQVSPYNGTVIGAFFESTVWR